jgi:hypothetical protein
VTLHDTWMTAEGSKTQWRRVSVQGVLNAQRQFLSKELSHAYTHDDPINDRSDFGEGTTYQFADAFLGDIYHVNIATDQRQTQRAYTSTQLLDHNNGTAYDPRELALGHGASQMISVQDSLSGTQTATLLEGWHGDTTAVDPIAAATHLDTVKAVTPRAAQESLTLGFTPEQQIDCTTLKPETTIKIEGLLTGACSQYFIPEGYFDCTVVQSGS